jgi:hypothetical protein
LVAWSESLTAHRSANFGLAIEWAVTVSSNWYQLCRQSSHMADLKAASSISTEKVLVLDERIGDYALAEKGTCNAAYIRVILLTRQRSDHIAIWGL